MNISCVDGTGALTLSDNLFDRAYSESLVHQLIVAYLAGARQGTHAQKTRSMVRGGGRKPWRQKGTGRARAGTNRSPLWRGGGKVFAKTTRDYSQKLNKKMYQAAVQSIFSELLRQQRLQFIGQNTLAIAEPRTKAFVQALKPYLTDEGVTTIIVKKASDNLQLATRNLRNVELMYVGALDPVLLVNSDRMLIEDEAAKELEQRWQ